MSQTKAGGLKARDIMYQKYGKTYYARIGSLGGKNGHVGGFNNKDVASRAGKLGGVKSRRYETPEDARKHMAYVRSFIGKRRWKVW